MLKMGIELTTDIKIVQLGDKIIYNIGMGSVLIYLENEITKEIISKIINYKSTINKANTIIVFKENMFKNNKNKISLMENLKQLEITDIRIY